MNVIICPGIHEPSLTESFVSGWHGLFLNDRKTKSTVNIRICPLFAFSPLLKINILQFLQDSFDDPLKSPVIFICFSAGVVGGIGAAQELQQRGGCVKAFIAVDGWGVPLWGDFPIHRISHDYFTHWSSKILGGGQNNFYADPPVDHLEIWRSPQTTQGYWVDFPSGYSPRSQRVLAAEFIQNILGFYEEN